MINRQGLTEKEVLARRQEFGKNILEINSTRKLFHILWDVVKEPMFLLLAAACILYFILGEFTEGFMMVAALCFVAAISVFQEIKSSNALEALQQLTEPKVKVIREGIQKFTTVENLVPGDVVLLEEGNKVPADGVILEANDLSINESVLTGESLPVEKYTGDVDNKLYQGTVINSGRCYAEVTATGGYTKLGKIGKSIVTYAQGGTLLQQQIGQFVKQFSLFGIVAFAVIFSVNYFHTGNVVASLLFGLTLAMSAIPEEIPVAFSSFMALGAYRMSRLGIISRQPQTVENLGAVNIICLDKTGTITENKMQVDDVYDYSHDTHYKAKERGMETRQVLYYAFLASEENPFDAMEQAIVEAYRALEPDGPAVKMIHEYPLSGRPPMMTHVYNLEGTVTATAKGGVEHILRVCNLPEEEKERIAAYAKAIASRGNRVLGVAHAVHHERFFPKDQDDFNWLFDGLVSFYDPPKPFIKDLFNTFTSAGIGIKILTGDYSETALTIAHETGLRCKDQCLTGDDVLTLSDEELKQSLQQEQVFARMYPEAKTRVIEVLRKESYIVGMTGDGVNDGPALKAADIGIALGEKGTEVARQSADLIVTDDDLRKVAEAIRQGRKIFSNLKKAIRYIISIHIPIILTASLPVLLGWKYPNIFTPIHIIFLELIMGPTCSIFFEREPVEENIMRIPPRKRTSSFFQTRELLISALQGLVITAGVLGLYYTYMQSGHTVAEVRTMVFATLIISNIVLTFVNRSFTESVVKTIRFKNELALPVFIISVVFLLLILILPFARHLFQLALSTPSDFLVCAATALVSVLWFEVFKRLQHPL